MNPLDLPAMIEFARAIVEGRDKTRLPIEVKLRALAVAFLFVAEKQ